MRTRHVIVLATALALAGATSADAQSTFLSKGVSGFGVGAGFGVGDGMNDLGGNVSASVMGIVDVGASLDRLSFDANTAPDLSALQVSPFATVHPLKMLEKVLPVHTSFGVAWQNTSYSGSSLDAAQQTMKTQGWTFEGTAYGTLPLSKNVNLIPDASVSHFTGTLETTDETAGDTLKVDADQTFWGAGATVALKLPTRNIVSGRMGVTVDEAGDSRFEANVGFTLPLGIGGSD